MRPRTPASSHASRAADFSGLNPRIGQPLGTIQLRVCRVVRTRISRAANGEKRYGSAPYWMRTAAFALRFGAFLDFVFEALDDALRFAVFRVISFSWGLRSSRPDTT